MEDLLSPVSVGQVRGRAVGMVGGHPWLTVLAQTLEGQPSGILGKAEATATSNVWL